MRALYRALGVRDAAELERALASGRVARVRGIGPELREDRGELVAAGRRALPRLVEPGDLRGDLHAHTNASDGRETLEQMAAGARAAGLEYLAITDHSRSRMTACAGSTWSSWPCTVPLG